MKIVYYAFVDIIKYPGVISKLRQIVSALKEKNYVSELYVINSNVFLRHLMLAKSLLLSRADIVVIRNSAGLVFCLPFIIILRLRSIKVIIDVPTPIVTTICELRNGMPSWRKRASIFFYLISFPLTFWPASKILQYSKESNWFMFGVKYKTKLIANGIDVKEIALKTKIPFDFQHTLVLVAVASMAEWHGFDRVIRGIADYYRTGTNLRDVKLLIVGDGAVRVKWERLVEDLGLLEKVFFLGFKTGTSLNEVFEYSHIGISSLGLYRKELELASDLKSREYTARGIPFVTAGYDLDFDPVPWFVRKVANNNSNIDIQDIINWYEELKDHFTPYDIRTYAFNKLDYSVKILDIL